MTTCLVATGVALAAANHRAAPRTTQPSAALAASATQADAALAADSASLSNVLFEDFPASFGGVRAGHGALTVYLTTPEPKGLAKVVDAYAPAGSVLYAHAARTYGALLAVHRSLSADWMGLQDRGIDIVGYSQNVAASKEQILVIGATPGQVALLDRDFGASMISVKDVGVAPIPSSFTLRVRTEQHAGVPRTLLPFLLALAAAACALVGAVVWWGRRPARRGAAPDPADGLVPALA